MGGGEISLNPFHSVHTVKTTAKSRRDTEATDWEQKAVIRGNQPAAKRVAIKEPWPMKGPGSLKGSTCIAIEAVAEESPQQGSSEFQEF